jgi:hypothetical protein
LQDPPAEPALPSPPDPPTDPSNQIQVVEYLNNLDKYKTQVTAIQDNYRSQMDIYKTTASIYQDKMIQYQEDLAQYDIARAGAVSSGEALISNAKKSHGWGWVDKTDPDIYYPWLIKTWSAQVLLMVLYLCIILILVKRKDAH